MLAGTGFVLTALAPDKAHLAESLADAGVDVVTGEWGMPSQCPQVIVTDDLQVIAHQERLRVASEQGLVGVIWLSPLPSETASPAAAIRPDAILPPDVSSRELLTTVGLVARITTLRRQQSSFRDECQRWIELAMHDSLTGLPNRRNWEATLEQWLVEPQPLNIAMVDLDFFKQVNDADGHMMGDRVLREAARAMRSQLRRSDFVARLGGDEFGLLLPLISADDAAATLERLRQQVSEHLASVQLPPVTLSVGFIHLDGLSPRDPVAAMSAASRSLRSAKQRQKNRTVGFPSSISTAATG